MGSPEDKKSTIKEDVEESVPVFPSRPNKSFFAKLGALLTNKKFCIPVLIVVIVCVGLYTFVKPVRFAVYNVFDDAKTTIAVIDETTKQPLAQATVTIQGKTQKTNNNGEATFSHLTFGDTSYTVQKDAYASVGGKTTLDLGNNPLGPISLKPTGVPLEVTVTNKLSGQKVTDYTATLAGTTISAQSNDKGIAILSVPPQDVSKVTLAITAKDYNKASQKLTIKPTGKNTITIEITPMGKHYFLSNRDGRKDVYSSNLDGTNQQLIIRGTGNENENTILNISPDKKYAVMISTRDNQRDVKGRTMQALFTVNFAAKTIQRIDEGALYFSPMGWMDNNKFVYSVQVGVDQNDYKIKTADVTTKQLQTLVKDKGDGGGLFFSEAPTYAYYTLYNDDLGTFGLYSLNLSTKAKKLLSPQGFNQLVHTKPGLLSLEINNQWKELNLHTQAFVNIQPPSAHLDRDFSISPDGNKLAWVEDRDGKGTVIIADKNGNGEKKIATNANASNVISWYGNDYVIVHNRKDESADYIIHIGSGKTTKISTVFNPYGYY